MSGEIIIPELEEAMAAGPVRGTGIPCWSPEDVEILTRYYGHVSKKLIMKHLPDHTYPSIQTKAARLGITGRGGRGK